MVAWPRVASDPRALAADILDEQSMESHAEANLVGKVLMLAADNWDEVTVQVPAAKSCKSLHQDAKIRTQRPS